MPAKTDVAVACSFCGKPHTEVVRLVAGPGVYICDACAALAVAVATGASEPRDSPVMPWQREMSLDEVLRFIRPVASVIDQADANLRAWVSKARALGASWADIGEQLGITRQSAWERFAADC